LGVREGFWIIIAGGKYDFTANGGTRQVFRRWSITFKGGFNSCSAAKRGTGTHV
jgi:hypothetical protein